VWINGLVSSERYGDNETVDPLKRKYVVASAVGVGAAFILVILLVSSMWMNERRLASADLALDRSVEAAHALSCESAAEYLKQAVARAEQKVTPYYLETVHWCFLHTVQTEDGMRALDELEQKISDPILKGTVLIQRADYLYNRHRNCEAALQLSREASDLLKDNHAEQTALSDAYRMIGTSYSCLQKLEEARTAFQKSVELDPQNKYSWNGLGLVAYHISNFDASAAEGYFQRALAIDPSYWLALLNLASINHLGRHSPENAVLYAEKFLNFYDEKRFLPGRISQYPEQFLVLYGHYILARNYDLLGDTRAVAAYEKAQVIVDTHREEIKNLELKLEIGQQPWWPWQIANKLEEAKVKFR
jgi:tetratricopeptide (TPR) repeat protein